MPYIIFVILFSQMVTSCTSSKIIFSDPSSVSEQININEIEQINCLLIDYRLDHNSSFNPKWIAHHGIKKVVAEYFVHISGSHEKPLSFDMYNFNEKGYLISSTASRKNPTQHYIYEKNLAVIHERQYEDRDSFLLLHRRQILFKDLEERLPSPDTVGELTSIINVKAGRNFVDDKGDIVRKYIYDNQNRLIEIYNKKGELAYKYNYLPDNQIELMKYYSWMPSNPVSVISLNAKGQIIENFNKDNGFLYKYKYDENGALLKRTTYFEGKMRHYFKFSYY